MLKISKKMRMATSILSKLVFAMAFACAIVSSMLFTKYKIVYGVKINNEDVGYASSKLALEKEIDNYMINGNGEDNVGYVVMNSKVNYELLLVNKDIETTDNQIFAEVTDTCDIYYKVYAIVVDGNEKGYVTSLEDAQKIVDGVNEKQEGYDDKSTIEIEEKYLQEYETVGDVEVAINDIYEPIKKANEIVKEIKTTPAAVKTVSDEVLLALKESLSELDFVVPVNNPVITSRFGWRSRGYHYGLDLACPQGTPITAAEDGVVIFADWCGDYGYLIRVQHAGEYETRYAHCSKIDVQVGDEVKKGDVIGEVGSTGRSTGPHCHMEIRYQGNALDPEVFLYE